MTMANGTQQEKKIQFKARKTATQFQPDAPEGEWEAIIPKGKCKVTVTALEKGGDPVLTIPFKLDKAEDEKNVSFQGSIINQRCTFYAADDGDHRTASNINLQWMREFIDHCELDFDKVYPAEVKSEDDFLPLIRAIEGKQLTIWTTHRKASAGSGEARVYVDIRFSKPGAGLVTRAANDDDEEEDERPGKRKTRGR
jgi:hypothetical protein